LALSRGVCQSELSTHRGRVPAGAVARVSTSWPKRPPRRRSSVSPGVGLGSSRGGRAGKRPATSRSCLLHAVDLRRTSCSVEASQRRRSQSAGPGRARRLVRGAPERRRGRNPRCADFASAGGRKARAVAAVDAQLAAHERLQTTHSTLSARMQTAALGLEGVVTRVHEVLAAAQVPRVLTRRTR
jgi:hypothetical protein